MWRLDYLLALSLLNAPPDSATPLSEPWLADSVRPALQQICLRLEILDPRETRYLLTRSEDLNADLNLLRRRYRELRDAPALNDSLRFPDREVVNDLLAFNRAYRQALGLRQPVELARWWELREAMQETDSLYQIWDTVRDARCDYYYVTVRRQALKKLREAIGEDAYYGGNLPPYVPVWRFEAIDP
jgi:hypothetical protein